MPSPMCQIPDCNCGVVVKKTLFLQLLEKMKIDDVVDASPVHLFCGAWGTIAAGLFAHPDNVAVAYGTGSCGLFFKVLLLFY